MTLLLAALLALTPVTAEQAKQAFPAIDLSALTDQQRGVFIDVAADVYNYAGCQDTLAICLNPAAKDPHALRMAALVKALDEKKLAGAGVDVTDPEPLPPGHPLWKFPNTIITPHIAGRSDKDHGRMVGTAVENLARFLDGRPLVNVVDKKKGY